MRSTPARAATGSAPLSPASVTSCPSVVGIIGRSRAVRARRRGPDGGSRPSPRRTGLGGVGRRQRPPPSGPAPPSPEHRVLGDRVWRAGHRWGEDTSDRDQTTPTITTCCTAVAQSHQRLLRRADARIAGGIG
jgi:hypothetical protein